MVKYVTKIFNYAPIYYHYILDIIACSKYNKHLIQLFDVFILWWKMTVSTEILLEEGDIKRKKRRAGGNVLD